MPKYGGNCASLPSNSFFSNLNGRVWQPKLFLWFEVYRIHAAVQLLFPAMPDKHAGDGRWQFHAPVAMTIGKGEIECDAAVRKRGAADNFRQSGGLRRRS